MNAVNDGTTQPVGSCKERLPVILGTAGGALVVGFTAAFVLALVAVMVVRRRKKTQDSMAGKGTT